MRNQSAAGRPSQAVSRASQAVTRPTGAAGRVEAADFRSRPKIPRELTFAEKHRAAIIAGGTSFAIMFVILVALLEHSVDENPALSMRSQRYRVDSWEREVQLIRDAQVDDAVASAAARGINARDETGASLLEYAIGEGSLVAVTELVRQGANCGIHDKFDNGALHMAVRSPDVLAFLLQQNLDPNEQNRAGETPLHRAAQVGDKNSVALLLTHRADPTIQDRTNNLPAMQIGSTYSRSERMPYADRVEIERALWGATFEIQQRKREAS